MSSLDFEGCAGSLLVASGRHPKIARWIMRHNGVNLTTSRYSRGSRGQESEASGKLADLSVLPQEEQRQQERMMRTPVKMS
ncbi:MAG: hypothetical protein ISS70_02750 [Phycisphaerae bacterium]|nr:hypothetical protein [Phycisphaerae bacterium]